MEFRHDSISELRISGYNDNLYRKINDDDPGIVSLAESIEKNGLLEPIVISSDGYIVSGHRRYAACRLVGLETLKCRTLPISSNDPRFLKILREYNRQRVKGIDEIIREQVVDVSEDDQQAIEQIIIDRCTRSEIRIDTIDIQGQKVRAEISKAKYPFLNAIIRILNDLRKYWPLSDRQIHYQLLNNPPLIHSSKPESMYCNDRRSYQALCDLMTRARLCGYIPWGAVHDPTRPQVNWDVYPNVEPFIKQHMDDFLMGYYRDYMKSQPCHIEIVGEKNTIAGIIKLIAVKYRIPYLIGRGYCSIHPKYELAERFKATGKAKLILLILSDHDPDGEEIAQSFARSMRDDFGLYNLEAVKVALTRQQVNEINLPPLMTAKDKSSNRKKFVEAYGEDVHELEAVKPDKLQAILEDAIRAVIDVDLFNREVEQERADIAALIEEKRRIIERRT